MPTKATLHHVCLIAKGEPEDQVDCCWVPTAPYHYALQLLNIGYLLSAVMTSNNLAVNSYHQLFHDEISQHNISNQSHLQTLLEITLSRHTHQMQILRHRSHFIILVLSAFQYTFKLHMKRLDCLDCLEHFHSTTLFSSAACPEDTNSQ